MLFKDNSTEAELLNGDLVDIYYDFEYSPAWTAPHSGTSMATEPDEPEEYEIFNIKVEAVQGSLVELSDEDESYVMGCLEESAKEIVDAKREYQDECKYEAIYS